jgi:N-acetyl sugar amidotransferase
MPQAYYGLPEEVRFCERCVMSNQRPTSYPEFRHTPDRDTPTLHIDDEGVCDACRFADVKASIDWDAREAELRSLLDAYRRDDGGYEVLVPGSGGKDSAYAAHVLAHEYDMNVLTCTWPPTIYTEIGRQNHTNWIEEGGFDNITFKPNGQTHRLLTRLAVENLLHPFQTFILGQKNLAPKIALRYDIPLIFYGENEAEYGNPIADNADSLRDDAYHTYDAVEDLHLGGVPVPELLSTHGLTREELAPYFPAPADAFDDADVDVRYLGYYLRWTPQENYYYAVENTGFQARPYRSEGTYSKYASIDDKIDDLHYYTTYIKFGIGRATYDAAHEIRTGHITRDDAVRLVEKFDGEVPRRYHDEVLEYIGMTPEAFASRIDEARSPHLWERDGDGWQLRHAVWH